MNKMVFERFRIVSNRVLSVVLVSGPREWSSVVLGGPQWASSVVLGGPQWASSVDWILRDSYNVLNPFLFHRG